MDNRLTIVNTARACIGTKEHTDRHRTILKIYNDYVKRWGLYQVKESDAWCATFVSACFIASGLPHIFPIECSCSRMLSKANTMGIWVENDAYKPKIGDLILYDWQDSGKGDNVGNPDHVGIVENVVFNRITVIEGNYSDSVKRRVIGLNSRYIRGYITPRY